MMQDHSQLVLITSASMEKERHAVAESDCACAADGAMLAQAMPRIDSASPYRLPRLYQDQLTERFHLGCNPLAGSGVALFNQPVLDLLNIFRQPHALADGVAAAGYSAEGLAMAQHLPSVGLLEPANGPHNISPTRQRTLTAWLHVTNDCNLRCPYCYVQKTPDRMTATQGQRTIEAVFRSAVANKFQRVKLKYSGGEASLNFPVVLIMQQQARDLAKRYGLHLNAVMLSNGVAITQRMIETMQRHDIQLMISLDGVGQYHDSQRPFSNGLGSFRQIERSLDRLADNGLTPSISITISRRNLDGLAAVVEYVLGRNLPFTLNFYRENDCSASFIDMAYDDEQVIAAMRAAFAVIEAHLPPYSLLDRLLDLARLDVPHDRACGAGDSYLVINHTGGVAKCHMELERPVTNIAAVDPLWIIQQDQTGLQNLPVEDKEGCRDCDWRHWCAGGCPLLTYRVTGRYDVKSPNCNIYQALFPEVLRLEGLRLLKYGLRHSIVH